MHRILLSCLRDPTDRSELRLTTETPDDREDVEAGTLVGATEEPFPIIGGIPDFVSRADGDQAQTADSFSHKWEGWSAVATAPGHETTRNWFIERYFGTAEAMGEFFNNRHRILDVGCGSGYSSALYLNETFSGEHWVGVDISSAISLAKQNLGHISNTHFVKADMLNLPFKDGSFDTILAEGTLHHTPSTRDALTSVVRCLEPGGVILFYVYRRKSVIREFTDDFVRDQVSGLPPDQAMELIQPLTELGRRLSALNVQVEIPDIPVLGISGGTYDIQRFIYWHVAKIFWNNEMSTAENDYTNFDWYHPRYAHRQSADEVRQWCSELDLHIDNLSEEDAGITVRAHLAR